MKYKIFFAPFIILILLNSCNHDKLEVGFMLPHMNNKRYTTERDVFTSRIKELGGEVLFYSANNDPQKQMVQLDEMLAKGVDIVVLDPVNRFTAAGMVRKIHENGIKVISYDRLIANSDPDAYISFNAKVIGEQMASFAVSKKPEGNYVILSGDKSDINAVWINDGYHNILAPYVSSGKINISFEAFVENWSEPDAKNILDKYIKYTIGKPDVILSSSDFLSKGCIDALTKNNYNPAEVIITGQGAEPFACRFMLKGQQSMSVYKSVKKLATLAADLSVKMIHGENVSEMLSNTANNGKFTIPANFLETSIVDSSKIQSIVIADGMVTEAELKE